MAIHRVTVNWTGFTGAPGYSNFFFTGPGTGGAAVESRDRVRGFFNAVRAILPTQVQFLVEGEVAVIDQATGEITGYVMAEPEPVTGQGQMTGGYSAASGAVVTWNTAGVRNSRRVRGRTFVVPISGLAYQNDGTLLGTTITTLNTAATELVGTGFNSGFGVWARPVGGSGGGFYEVNGFRVPDKAAVLRSRRD